MICVFCFLFSCAFITFEKMESADLAVAEVGAKQFKKNLTVVHVIFLPF